MTHSEPQTTENLHRLLPSVDALLQLLPEELARWGHPAVTECLRDILAGFLTPDERVSYGRPVGVAIGPDGSLLVADDVGDAIWRVTGGQPARAS